jgi:hypothetical protein
MRTRRGACAAGAAPARGGARRGARVGPAVLVSACSAWSGGVGAVRRGGGCGMVGTGHECLHQYDGAPVCVALMTPLNSGIRPSFRQRVPAFFTHLQWR